LRWLRASNLVRVNDHLVELMPRGEERVVSFRQNNLATETEKEALST
jgi:hypothetical protein